MNGIYTSRSSLLSSIRDETVCKFHIMFIVTKVITVISIITVLLKCAENIQKALMHTLKSFHQILH